MPFFTTSEGTALHYEVAGSGPPLVFLHGWAMSSRVWLWQREEMRHRYRVITVDLRGHGDSLSEGNYSLEALTADLVALVQHLELANATLVGWSLGAELALATVAALPKAFAALILVGGTPRFTSCDGFPHGVPPEEVRGMALRLRRNYTRTMGEFFRGMFAGGELDHEQEQLIVHRIVLGGRLPEPRTAEQVLTTLSMADLRPILTQINVPTLLIHGTNDEICLPGASRFMADHLPDAQLHLMPGLGHAPFLSRPDDFNRLLRQFLTGIYGRD